MYQNNFEFIWSMSSDGELTLWNGWWLVLNLIDFEYFAANLDESVVIVIFVVLICCIVSWFSLVVYVEEAILIEAC